jgi:hypothetical protein
MRLVTFHDICKEVGHGVYAATDRTKFFVRKSVIGGFNHIYHFGLRTSWEVPELIQQKRLHQFPKGPDERTVVQETFGDSMFGLLSKDSKRKQVFDDYMGARAFSQDDKWFDVFPAADQLKDGLKTADDAALIVDVGGGRGFDIVAFRQRFPDLPGKFILQDLPHTFKLMQSKPEGITIMAHGFFTEQPVKGRLFKSCYPALRRADQPQVLDSTSCTVCCTTGRRTSVSISCVRSWPRWTVVTLGC